MANVNHDEVCLALAGAQSLPQRPAGVEEAQKGRLWLRYAVKAYGLVGVACLEHLLKAQFIHVADLGGRVDGQRGDNLYWERDG